MGFTRRFSCMEPKRTSSFLKPHKLRSKRHSLRNQTQRSTAIRVRVMPFLVIMGRITTPPRLTLPTVGRANFCISNYKEIRDDKNNRDRAIQSDDFQAVG